MRHFPLVLILAALLSPGAAAHGDLDERIEAVTAKLHGAEKPAALLVERADLHFQHEEYDKALRDLLFAEGLDPKAAPFPLLRARALLPAGLPRLAVEELRPFLASSPNHPQAWLLRAQALLSIQEMKDAALAYDQATALLPRIEPQVVLEQCRAWAASGQEGPATALNRLDAAIAKLGADIPALLDCRLELLVRTGKIDEACASLDQQAAKLNRKDAVLLKKAELLSGQKRHDLALTALLEAKNNLASLPAHVQQRPDVVESKAAIEEKIKVVQARVKAQE